MKYLFLLLFFIFMVLLWQWRHRREPKVKEAARKKAAAIAPPEMVPCAHCGLHLPATEAVKTKAAVYCCIAHAQEREQV